MKNYFKNSCHQIKMVVSNPIFIVGMITVFGALIRRYHLAYKPLWLDEAVLYKIANSGNIRTIIQENAFHNSAPPLFSLLLATVIKAGNAEKIIRLLPWSGGVLSIVAIYFLSRQFLERLPSYFVTFIVSISVTQITYSQELREYSLTFFISAIILALFARQVAAPSWKNILAMALTMTTGIFLQYGIALLVLALNLTYALALFYRKEESKRLLLQWSVSQIVVLLAVVSVFFLSLKDQMAEAFGSSNFVTYLTSGYGNGSLKSFFGLFIYNTGDLVNFTYPGILFGLMVLIGLLCILRYKNEHLILQMAVIPLLLTLFVATFRLYPYLGARQDIFLTPIIYLVFGFGVSYLIKVIPHRTVTLVLVLFIVGTGINPVLSQLKNPGTENMRAIAHSLSKSFKTGDMIYVYYAAEPAFSYYSRTNPDAWIVGTYNRGNLVEYFTELNSLINKPGRFWMVFSHCYANECVQIPDYVSQKRQVEAIVTDNDAFLYFVH